MMAAILLLLMVCAAGCEKKPPEPACTDPLGCVTIEPEADIRIGVIQALSGKVASLGNEQLRGIRLALDDRQNRVAGRTVVLQTEDTGCSAEGGTNAALKILANPQTAAVIGTTCSTAAAAASKVITQAGMTMISGNNSAPFLTSIGGNPAPDFQKGYFRTASNEENAGKAAALYAYQHLGLKTAALINDGDIYTTGLTRGFHAAFEQLEGEIVLTATVNKGDTDMEPVLTAVDYTDAQLLFFPLFQPEGNHILFKARQIPGLKDVVLMSDGALIESTFIRSAGKTGIGMYFVGPAKPDTAAATRLEAKYEKKFNTPPKTSYYLNAYDAANLLFTAIETAVQKTPDGGLVLGRDALRQTLYTLEDFQGATGELDCDEFGDCAFPRFNVLRLDDPEKGVAGLQANIVFQFSPE